MKHIIFLATLLSFLTACKQAPAAKKLQLQCYLRYSQEEGRLRAEASLQDVSDPAHALPLQPADGISIGNKEMKQFPGKPGFYTLEREVPAAASFAFHWKNEDGKTDSLPIPIPELADFGFSPQPISLHQPAKLIWKGQPLNPSETLHLLWENEEKGSIPMQVMGAGGTPVVDFPAAEISKLSPGDWRLYIVRKRVFQETINGVAVKGVCEFYTPAKAFTVAK